MGITRDSRKKHRLTGGRRNVHQKKRKHELARPAANTKLGEKSVHFVRGRGANMKYRAIRLDSGTFSWGSEGFSSKTRVLDVVYNASNNELVRTKTLVKNAIIAIDGSAFRQYYERRYGVELGKRKKGEESLAAPSKRVAAARSRRLGGYTLDPAFQDQFNTGRVLACISSRPGQSGRCDGYVLEGDELHFYQRKLK